ncbi:hypothetical protein [Phytoactinopolyspora endophytica]|nr:hypothetical protein [Phytoactinopolyspora endophytica]
MRLLDVPWEQVTSTEVRDYARWLGAHDVSGDGGHGQRAHP